jgi:hypothetical protein
VNCSRPSLNETNSLFRQILKLYDQRNSFMSILLVQVAEMSNSLERSMDTSQSEIARVCMCWLTLVDTAIIDKHIVTYAPGRPDPTRRCRCTAFALPMSGSWRKRQLRLRRSGAPCNVTCSSRGITTWRRSRYTLIIVQE